MTRALAKIPILVVDDETAARSALNELLRDEGYDVHAAADGFKALGRVDNWTPDVVITDLRMPGMDGIELMAKLRERIPGVSVVVMTAFGSVKGAVDAMQAGADDFLTKPVQLEHLLIVLRRVLDHRHVRKEAARLRTALEGQTVAEHAGLIGRSKSFRDTIDLARLVAGSDATVLIVGEGGTGKNRLARALHEWGSRSTGRFVTVSCSSPDAPRLLERLLLTPRSSDGLASEGADADEPVGGTLFLDEIEQLSQEAQLRFLKYLQDHSDVSDKAISSYRIVAASTLNLQEAVDDGRFREELYYRLNVVTLRTPALRERREDILLLANHFLRTFAMQSRKGIDGFTDRALAVLFNFDWPGNIRQLETCVERAVAVCKESEIEPRHLPREVMVTGHGVEAAPMIPGSSLRDIERYAILRTLEQVGGSTSKAARILGISPRKIQYRLNEYRETQPSGIPAVEPAPKLAMAHES